MCCSRYWPRLPVPMKPNCTWSLAAFAVCIAAAATPAVFTKSLRVTSCLSAIGIPILHEVVFYLLKKTLFRRLIFHRQNLAQLFKKLLLRAVELGGNLHLDMDEQIAAPVPVDMRDTLA